MLVPEGVAINEVDHRFGGILLEVVVLFGGGHCAGGGAEVGSGHGVDERCPG